MGLFQNLLHQFDFVFGLFAPVLHVDVLIDHSTFQGPRAIQSGRRDDVQKVVRLHPLQQVSNPTAFHLENALRFAALQKSVSRFVIKRKIVDVDSFATSLLDDVHHI